MTTKFEPVAAKARLLQLVRERAYKDGIDIVLASGKRSTFYINGKKVSLHPEGLWLIAKLLLEKLKAFPEVTAVGGLTLGADPLASGSAPRVRPPTAVIPGYCFSFSSSSLAISHSPSGCRLTFLPLM